MEPKVPLKDYVDAQDGAIETRLMARIEKLATTETVRNNIWGAAIAIIATILAVLAFGGDRFDGGVNASAMMREQGNRQAATDRAQDAQLEVMNQKLDVLIKQTAGD